MTKDRYCLMTNDVETTSILNHKLRDKTGEYVLRQGMPRLLDLYERYGVKATFFYTGYIARLYPDVVRMAHSKGHEIGSHGLTHEVSPDTVGASGNVKKDTGRHHGRRGHLI